MRRSTIVALLITLAASSAAAQTVTLESAAAVAADPNGANPDGFVYLFGGHGELTRTWAYDPTADVYLTRAPVPVGVRAATAVESGGKIYLFGGLTQDGSGAQLVQVYDPAFF